MGFYWVVRGFFRLLGRGMTSSWPIMYGVESIRIRYREIYG